jgi:hypothetical protein
MMIFAISWICFYILGSMYILNHQRVIANVKYKLEKYGVLYDGL